MTLSSVATDKVRALRLKKCHVRLQQTRSTFSQIVDAGTAFQLDDDVRGRSQLQSLTAPSRPPSRTASRASQRTLRGSDVEMNENVSGMCAFD